MPTTLPAPYDAPAKLLAVDGHCGLLVAWCIIRHFRRRTSADRLIRACGYTRRYGVFTIALATALTEHGLDVTFHSYPDKDMKPLERHFYRRALALRIPMLPPLSLSELLTHADAGRVPIVFHDTLNGQGHFSPLLGERCGRLILPYSHGGAMSRTQFIRRWSAPEILRQCVIVKGRTSRRLCGSTKSVERIAARGTTHPKRINHEHLMQNELFDICCERNPNPADQRRRLAKLLRAGADIHVTDKNGVTALHHAVRFRSPAAVKTLIEHGANINQVCRRNGSTPLHRAVTQTGAPGTAGKGQAAKEILQILLAAGADPSITNKSGKKPADYVTDETIKSLLKKR